MRLQVQTPRNGKLIQLIYITGTPCFSRGLRSGSPLNTITTNDMVALLWPKSYLILAIKMTIYK